jgi:hypothetical protein
MLSAVDHFREGWPPCRPIFILGHAQEGQVKSWHAKGGDRSKSRGSKFRWQSLFLETPILTFKTTSAAKEPPLAPEESSAFPALY